MKPSIPLALIQMLADGQCHSGEDIGQHLGVSRAAVWKQLQKLRDIGLKVSSVKGKGYSLQAPLNLLDKEQIAGQLSANVAASVSDIHVLPVVDSTNSYLLKSVGDGSANQGALCFAEFQQAGRGRRGRRWHSPFGANLYFSLLWQFEHGAAALEGLSLAVGVVIADVLREQSVPVELKWPNDLLVQQAKLGGILLEMVGDPSGRCQVVIGIGLNVAMPAVTPADIDQPWVSLEQWLPDISRNKLAALLVNQLVPMLAAYPQTGFAPYRQSWNQWDAYKDRPAKVISGEQVTQGIVRGVAEQGALLFEENGVVAPIYGGELSLRFADDS